jgi:hypothetical protein
MKSKGKAKAVLENVLKSVPNPLRSNENKNKQNAILIEKLTLQNSSNIGD